MTTAHAINPPPVPTAPPLAVARSQAPAPALPFTAPELETAWADWSRYSPVLADVLLVLARTGLRWSEARAVTVADADPEQLIVDKSASEGSSLRHLRPDQVRRVPVPTRVRPVLRQLLVGRDGAELLFTTSLGRQLSRGHVLRRLNWDVTGRGRSLLDLRRTAEFLWLADGVAPLTVRAWLGPSRLSATVSGR